MAARLLGRARRRASRRDDGSRPRRALLSPARLPAVAVALSAGLDAFFLLVTWPGHPSSFYGFGGHHATLARDVAAAAATGRSVAIHPALVPDRLQLDLALARTLEEAAAAGTRSRVPYLIARTPPAGATFLDVPIAAAGAPRHDPWGLVLYRVLPP